MGKEEVIINSVNHVTELLTESHWGPRKKYLGSSHTLTWPGHIRNIWCSSETECLRSWQTRYQTEENHQWSWCLGMDILNHVAQEVTETLRALNPRSLVKWEKKRGRKDLKSCHTEEGDLYCAASRSKYETTGRN